jgi:protein Mpv17
MLITLAKLPGSILGRYNKALLNSPYKTKMATAGFTYMIADCICQAKVEKKDFQDYSPLRSARQASVGAFFAAPSLHVWHSILLPKLVKFCTRNVTKVLLSVFLNETALASYFISCLLFSFESLKTMSVQAGAQNVQNKFIPVFESSMKFWTGISLVNYSLVPIHLRPVFVSCWSMVWQTYVSYISNNKKLQVEAAEIREQEERDLELRFIPDYLPLASYRLASIHG